MSERDDSHDLEALLARLEAARSQLARIPISNSAVTGPVDPSTGEAWHRGNVLGHMVEMLSYWPKQLESAAAGSREIGRDEEGAKLRRRGIDVGEADDEANLRDGVDSRIGHVLDLLKTWSPDDLERKVVYQRRDGDREVRVGELVQILIVGHVEGHLAQLASLDKSPIG
jgi:hypothetical protein